MLIYWKYFFFLLWFGYLLVASLLLFAGGFLLNRAVLPNNSTCSESHLDFCISQMYDAGNAGQINCFNDNNLWENLGNRTKLCLPPRGRVALLVIDALRYDFTLHDPNIQHPLPYQNKLPYISHLLKTAPERTRLFKFIADPPTTTMQRLKALTTGSLPTFIDAGSNFATTEINEDNIIDQLISNDKKVVFMGDDTWGKLYTYQFIRNYPFPSFNVFDLDTVDRGVLSNLYNELEKDDWSLLIGHFLGVDHCGHRYGPTHMEMSRKLGEMNEVIRNVTQNLADDVILFVIGDHGMTRTGDHGGQTPDEVTAAMFVYSKMPLLTIGSELYNDTIKQVDLIPTLSAILGIPIPYSNLGMTVLNALPAYKSKRLETWQTLLLTIWNNVQQSTDYIEQYAHTSGTFSRDKLDTLHAQFENLTVLRTNASTHAHFQLFLVEAQAYIYALRTICEEVWVQFDSISMSRGLILNFLVIFFVYTVIDGIPFAHFPAIFRSSFLPFSYATLGVTLTVSVICYQLHLVNDLLLTVFFFTCAVSVFLFAILVIQNWEVITWHWFNLSKYQSVTRVMCRIIFALSSFAVFANSYILEEAAVTSYLFLTLVLLIAYESACATTKQPKSKGHYASAIVITVAIFLLVRLSKMYWRCRDEQIVCNTLPPEQKSFTGSSGKLQYIITLVSLALCVTFTRNVLSDNLVGMRPQVFLARYAPTVMVVCTGGYWVLHRLPSDARNRLDGWQVSVFAWVVLGLIAAQLIALLVQPLCVYVVDERGRLSVDGGGGGGSIVPQLFNIVKGWYEGGRRRAGPNVFYVCGLATVYSATFVIVGVQIVLLMALVLGDAFASSSILLYFAVVFLLGIVCVGKYENAKNLFEVENSALLAWVLLSHYFFYGTGHQPTFPNIPWEAAFVGTFEGNFIRASLVIFNIYGATIFMGLMLPLIFIAPFSLPVLLPQIFRKQPVPHDTTPNHGEMILYENSELMFTSVFSIATKYLLYHAARIFFCLMATTIHCRHLMVWGVFAPKLIFEIIGMLVTIVSVLLSFLLLIHINRNVDLLYTKFYKQSGGLKSSN